MARWKSAIVAGGLVFSGNAVAQTAQNVDQLESQLNAMQKQMRVLQQRVEEAKAQAAAAEWAASQSVAAAKQSKHDDLDLKVKWKGAPELSTKDGKFKMKVRGRIQADYNAINQDTGTTGQPDVSAAELRRARLGVEGILWYDVKYKFEVDFAGDGTAIKDAYLEYMGLCKELGIRIGNFKSFNSLEHMTSSRFITFMERSAFVDAFGLDRQIGVGAIWADEHYTVSLGAFGPHSNEQGDWLNDVRSGAARATWAPINGDRDGRHTVLHLGASWRTRHGAEDLRANPIPANDQLFRYRAHGADLHLADRFVATPQIFDQDTFWGLETAVVWGPLSLQAEYAQLHADLASGFVGASPTYNGWYVEGSWYLTGETRTYKEGEFGRPKVLRPVYEGGPGAWQLAVKYDVLDLSDEAVTIVTCTECGNQNTWLIGVNWWLNDYTRVTFNYNQSSIDGGFLNGANVNDGAKIKGFGARAQVDW
jgi:phosphate-selective porin OprO/OprP